MSAACWFRREEIWWHWLPAILWDVTTTDMLFSVSALQRSNEIPPHSPPQSAWHRQAAAAFFLLYWYSIENFNLGQIEVFYMKIIMRRVSEIFYLQNLRNDNAVRRRLSDKTKWLYQIIVLKHWHRCKSPVLLYIDPEKPEELTQSDRLLTYPFSTETCLIMIFI